MLILVGGLKNSGKDYFSDEIVSVSDFKKVSYAYEIKLMLCKMFNLKMAKFENAKKLQLGIYLGVDKVSDMRTFIQTFGTEVMQSSFGRDVWSEKLFEVIKNPNENFIISDFRFKQEYAFLLKNYKGEIVTILIDDKNLKPDSHQSENDLLDFSFDIVINNTSKKQIDVISLLKGL